MILENKRAQMTIFVIIAIVVVAGILVYLFVFRNTSVSEIGGEFKPVYDSYMSCVEQETRNAADLAGSQGGHLNVGSFAPGSDYSPFSSQLNFLGFPVPYWYYVSGNGIIKEQVPTKSQIEEEMAAYIQSRIGNCNFDSFRAQGFSVDSGDPIVTVTIQDTSIITDVNSAFVVSRGQNSARKVSHEVQINSKLGKFYNIAKEIYDKEKNEMFLENYSIDVLRLNAPVDGVELSCGPKIWKSREIDQNIRAALEANIAAIRIGASKAGTKDQKYFTVPMNIDENVNMIYNQNWSTKVEISGPGVDNELMTSEPVGNQQGLGIMGFCYVPYHFVYDVSFPVMIQVYNNEELFQFPVSVIISKNLPRQAALNDFGEEPEFDFCKYNTQDISVNVKDVNLGNVDANISYECFDQQCKLGETQNGTFEGKAPACLNGYIIARANGYEEKSQLFSSNEETTADVIVDRQYGANVNLKMDGKPVTGNAVVAFTRNDSNDNQQTFSAVLPDSPKLKLTEGYYTIKAYVYANSSITIPGSTKTQCEDVPKSGLLGMFGGTNQQCYDINLPETKIDKVLIGGGTTETYIFPSDLEKGTVNLAVAGLPVPSSIDQLQTNFDTFDNLDIGVDFGQNAS